MRTSWIAELLHVIAQKAGEHPLLVGALLVLILVSTALHVLIFGAHLLLGMSKYLRRQVAELQDLTHLYREEGAYWRQILDIMRVRSMTPEQVSAQLERKQIDAQHTTEVVTAFVDVLLLRLRAEQQEGKTSPRDTSGDEE